MKFESPPKARTSFHPQLNFNFPHSLSPSFGASTLPSHSSSYLSETLTLSLAIEGGLAMKGGKSNSKKGDNKLAVKRKGAATTKAAKKAAKDPNKPKRPPSAFFVFMEEFRKHYKEKHPSNKSVAVVGKAGGDKWKSLTDDEKAPYISKAEKRKADYEKTMKAYNKKQAEAPKAVEEDEDSDKSRSEVNDDEDDEDEEGSGEEDDDE
ncbi:HMG1/2-like protein isoform X4 [Malania oleifera]|uniref:HMG1/2-like protein isoform X4 n=1 Tax=Malania oleifera TaxID=397392 RepID=UPI0025ADC198|nr:HMG1/2-like protein isoform X4 [Malania oleifera]